MKYINSFKLCILLSLAALAFLTCGAAAQPSPIATYYSLSGQLPPMPFHPFPELPTEQLGDNAFVYDDSMVDYPALREQQASAQAAEPPTPGGEMGGGDDSPTPLPDYGCGLWLSVQPVIATNVIGLTNLLLTLHNTFPGTNYPIWSKTNLSLTSWTAETNVIGNSTQSFTQLIIPMRQRPELFLIASEPKDYVLDTNTNAYFAGLSYLDTSTHPPDTMGAAGQNHFVEILNGTIAAYSKTSGTQLQAVSSFEFFSLVIGGTNYASQPMLDPRIVYDHQSNRWVACAFGSPAGVILAVSTNDNPLNLTNNWTKYLVPSSEGPDFPTLGLDANGVYLSYCEMSGYKVVAIKKSALYAGTLPSQIITNNTFSISNTDTIQPAVNFDAIATNDPAWFVTMGVATNTGSPYGGTAVQYRRLQWTGNVAAWVESNFVQVAEPPAPITYRDYFPPSLGYAAPQAGGSNKISVGQNRLSMSVVRNGLLYTCQHVGLSGTNGTYATNEVADRSGVQWLKFQAGSQGLTYLKHGRIHSTAATNQHSYYYPSMTVTCAGDMVFGFSGSSLTNFVSAYYAWQPASGTGSAAPRPIKGGDDYYLSTGWGDYSATSLDPSYPNTVWTVQQYATQPGDTNYNWGTWIAKIKRGP